jgi:nucleoside-diphosphate-sugar epimerase
MISSDTLPTHQSGIYRNLPTFDLSTKGLTAIVVGATGISGWNTIRCLLDSPHRWSKVYALSRSPPKEELLSLLRPDQRARIQHVSIDLLGSPEDVASSLKTANVLASHVFYYAYLQPKHKEGEALWSNPEELRIVNVQIFTTFMECLPIADIEPQRILLQTGGKHYGMQLGRTRSPCVESDPEPRHLGPNFYYPQEDLLFAYCKQHPATSWNIIRPGAVLGATVDASMNGMYCFAVYAAIQAEKKESLVFPSDWFAWQQEMTLSSARMTGYLSEWAILEDKCKNQAFNAQDGGTVSWDRLWHELGRWYGLEDRIVGPLDDESNLKKLESAGGTDSPMGYGAPLTVGMRYLICDWARDKANRDAWEQISRQGELLGNPFGDSDATFGIADTFFMRIPTLSMGKARRMGWNGFVDTMESAFEAVSDMMKMRTVPAMKVDAARPMI